jgi:hypothetical protein
LQFYWKITAGDEDPMCENPECPTGRPVIPHDRSRTGPRKRFCSDTCRARAHYVNKRRAT